ncbi:MAG: DUF4112 domain-containing protein [Chthoniobacteraceae bacterium]
MNTRSKAETIDVEVLPPEKSGDPMRDMLQGESDALPRLVALFMDSLFKMPGTKFRFGMNPVIDLLPVVGDGAGAVISGLTLFVAARYRVPKVVLVRMSANILLNGLIGIIPGVGEVFAFWFRPSTRNYRLLQKHIAENHGASPPSTRGDWLFVSLLVGGVLTLFLICICVGTLLTYKLLRYLFS